MAVTVRINGKEYVGLKGPWPEDPTRKSTRQGSTLQCIPGIAGGNIVAGKTIHVDIGHEYSRSKIEIVLPYVPLTDLKTILSHYHSVNQTTVTYRDPRNNTWECVYEPNTTAVDVTQHEGFDDRTAAGPGVEAYEPLYRVSIKLNVISKISSGELS